MAPPKNAHGIEAESEESDSGVSDLDSIYSDPDTASMTETLASMWTKYKFQNGRRYAAHANEGQIVPNDEKQQEGLDIFHEVYLTAGNIEEGLEGNDRKLYHAPIGDNVQRILDVGTGTGIWAMQCADQHPSAEVVGFDISPIQPTWIPPNCTFEVNDFNADSWSYTANSFDFVHVRACHSNVNDWKAFLKNAYKVIKPGGWIEVCGEVAEMRCDDGTLPDDSPVHLWIKCAKEGTDKIGRPMRYDDVVVDYMKEAGFRTDTIKSKFVKIPIGIWPKDKKLKQLGAMNLIGLLQTVEGYMLALYTNLLGWSVEDTMKHKADVERTMRDKRQHAYFRYQYHIAQKPMTVS